MSDDAEEQDDEIMQTPGKVTPVSCIYPKKFQIPKSPFVDKSDFEGQMVQQESGHFTVSGISNALGMGSEEKTVGRVFEKLLNNHNKKISKISVRNGKIFEYHYHIPTDYKNQK